MIAEREQFHDRIHNIELTANTIMKEVRKPSHHGPRMFPDCNLDYGYMSTGAKVYIYKSCVRPNIRYVEERSHTAKNSVLMRMAMTILRNITEIT